MKFAKHQLLYFSIIFIFAISIISHLLFSWIGFNPTDDGFILSLSRRIIDGQFPHRDFIFIRPALSPLIHMPFVYFGGEYTFWISRFFVWFELASISCIWTVIILYRFFSMEFNFWRYLFFAAVCFVFSTYTTFILAYTTYDALLLYSLGLLICFRDLKYSRFAGYFIIGLAYLCRQNFILFVPVTLWMFSDLKRIKYWIIAILPGLIYLSIMIFTGTLNDFTMQVLSLSGRFHGGFKVYVSNWGFWVSVIFGFTSLLAVGRKKNKTNGNKVSLLQWIIYLFLPVLLLLLLNKEIYPLFISFCIFGLVSGITLYFIFKKQERFFRPGIFLLLTGWVLSISIGMSYPALMVGEYVLFIIVIVLNLFDENTFSERSFRLRFNTSSVILLVLILIGFANARLTYTYRDKPSGELNYKVDELIKGTKNIQTNANTHLFLKDLRKAVSLTSGRTYCILPDLSAYWVKSSVENPLPISWANKTELNNRVFNSIVKDKIKNEKDLIFIMQKVFANSIQNDSSGVRLGDSYSPIIPFIKDNFRKFSETQYFELYE